MFKIIPDPGPLPTKAAPSKGSKILLRVEGLPPYKEFRYSIRNPKHRHHQRFRDLREAAIKAMKRRCWSTTPIELFLLIHASKFDHKKDLLDYLGGVMDTLDGSHGVYFTYLPIVYQDDCQVSTTRTSFTESAKPFYEIEIRFL